MSSPTRRRWKRAIWGALALLVFLIGGIWWIRPMPPSILTGDETMMAIAYREYGGPDVVHVETVSKPLPADHQVLIRVVAAAANPLDWHSVRGDPYLFRVIELGLTKPVDPRVGADVAGVVEAVGKDVKQFKPGDEVFGVAPGAFAEYAVASQRRIALKPANLTFAQAAAIPVAAMTALQGLRDKGRIRAGQKVLINGASGGVGTFAIQIAKSYGAEVTAVCSTRNVEMVRALGADHVIDYTREDFANSPERFDVILDNVGTQPVSAFTRVAKPEGVVVLIGGGGVEDGGLLGAMMQPIKAQLLAPFAKQELVFMLADVSTADLTVMKELTEAGKVTPIIDRTYPLSAAAEAIRYLEAGRARGKVIVSVAEDPSATGLMR
jgi:NADPH:quinone reductase-like Zn-dependent oxidoreductase